MDWSLIATIGGTVLGAVTLVNSAAWCVLQAVFPSRVEVVTLERRIAELEGKLDDIPTRSEIGDLKVAITRIEGTVSTVAAEMRGRFDGLKDLLERVETVVGRHESIFADQARG